MAASQSDVAGDGGLIDLDRAAGGPGPASLPDMTQHLADLLVGEAGLLQDGALALGEAGLAGAAEDHANAFTLATVTPEGEISLAPTAGRGALGILATEVLDGWHDDPP